MKVFFTDDHPLQSMLPNDWKVVSKPEDWFTRFIDRSSPRETVYKLKAMALRTNPDIVFIVDIFRQLDGKIFGYKNLGFRSWPQTFSDKLVVALSANDPFVWSVYRNRQYRNCVIRPVHCGLYVTDDMATAKAASGTMRAAFFDSENPSAVFEAIEAARERRSLRPDDKRLFT